MKKLLLLLFIPIVCLGQIQINNTEITIIQSSTQINIGWDGNFQDNIERQFDVLGLRQENYDRNWNILNEAYSKVMKQDFISPPNKFVIKEWKTQVEEWIKTNNLQGIDWSINENYAIAWRKRFLSIYNDPNIKSEIILLQAINDELDRLKRTHPGKFHKTKRFGEILNAIYELKNLTDEDGDGLPDPVEITGQYARYIREYDSRGYLKTFKENEVHKGKTNDDLYNLFISEKIDEISLKYGLF